MKLKLKKKKSPTASVLLRKSESKAFKKKLVSPLKGKKKVGKWSRKRKSAKLGSQLLMTYYIALKGGLHKVGQAISTDNRVVTSQMVNGWRMHGRVSEDYALAVSRLFGAPKELLRAREAKESNPKIDFAKLVKQAKNLSAEQKSQITKLRYV